ncbi:porin [Aeromonas fluvialis]|uniref:porin n=1 Tax=Aeromonas fluvialis TaxID=591962 RepID=UPI0005AAE2FA|nr:porin [Aeromonas fluvialis]
MKKTILAIAIPALFASAANAATVYDKDGTVFDVYGRAQFDVYDDGADDDFNNNDSQNSVDGMGSARLGVKGKVALNDKIAGIAKGEWGVTAENTDNKDDKDNFKARHAFAGFEHADYGTLVFGQSDTAFYQAVAATDIFNTYGYEAFSGIEVGRQEGQVIYTGNFGGFYVGASYQFQDPTYEYSFGGQDQDGNEFGFDNVQLDSSYAGTLGYVFDFGLAVYGGVHYEDLVSDNIDDKTNYALSASYTWNSLYLGAAYVHSDLNGVKAGNYSGDLTLDGYDLVASYGIDAWTLYTGYAYQEADGDNVNSLDTADAFKLGVQYSFTSNFKTWAEYQVNNLDDADDAWTVALQYNF